MAKRTRGKTTMHPCACGNPDHVVPVTAARAKASKTGRFFFSDDCRLAVLAKDKQERLEREKALRPICALEGCPVQVPRLNMKYCGQTHTNEARALAKRSVLVPCSYDPTHPMVERTPAQIKRASHFFDTVDCRRRFFANPDSIRPCGREGCPNTAIHPDTYCGRKCANQRLRVEKVWLDCVRKGEPDCKGGREYYPSQLPKTGRGLCSDHCRKIVGTKPRKGTMVRCGYSSDEVPLHDFYRGPSSDQEHCCPEHVHLAARQNWPWFDCQWVDCPVGRFQVQPSMVKWNANRFHDKVCEALARIERKIDRDWNGRPVIVNSAGYLLLWQPDHPKACHGRVFEHVYVEEQANGPLPAGWEVHHKDENPQNNDPSNLERMTKEEHQKIHGKRKWSRLRKLEVEVAELRSQLAEQGEVA